MTMIKLTMDLFTHCLRDFCIGAIQGIIDIEPGDQPIVRLCLPKCKILIFEIYGEATYLVTWW